MRLLILILLSVLVLFQHDFWFGSNGFLDYRQNAEKIKENQAENEKLSQRNQRNQRINAEIQGLTKGFEAIEERARMQHGLVKENEVFYHIVKESK
ncbi:TPA: cell division protein FtsB [Haemophilus influenzae]